MKSHPALLVEQLRALCKKESGFSVHARLRTTNPASLIEFMPFRKFIAEEASRFQLADAGEFYFNLEEGGFTGISRFDQAYVTIFTTPEVNDILIEIFISNVVPGNFAILREIYHRMADFLRSEVISDQYLEAQAKEVSR